MMKTPTGFKSMSRIYETSSQYSTDNTMENQSPDQRLEKKNASKDNRRYESTPKSKLSNDRDCENLKNARSLPTVQFNYNNKI